MITFEYAQGHEVVGRTSEINTLREALSDVKIKAVVIGGGVGVGKTALANRLLEMAGAGALAGRFEKQVSQSAYQETWERFLSQIAEKLIGSTTVLKATKNELEDRILATCRERQVLLVVDNIESRHLADAGRFIEAWLRASQNSVLLITTREELDIESDSVRHLHLTGLADKYPQLELLGEVLRRRFGADPLAETVAGLNGVPLNLLYLRWLDPQTEDDLEGHVSGLIAGTVDKSIVLEDVLASISLSPTAFMALGVVRQLEFEERLLTSFWDRMGGGNTEAYIELRDRLISAGLLIPVTVQDSKMQRYRINEDIHKQLYRALSSRIGGQGRIPTVHFFASEYYRRVFESNPNPALDALSEFVYHCLSSGEHVRAYEYIFESNILPSLHQAGMAIQLKGILELFLNIETLFSSLQQCKILIEMAHVCNDLSEFDRCLRLMERAESLLHEMGEAVSGAARAALFKRICYYSAVAYSNTGHSEECLQSYFRIVSAASGDDDRLACVSLAYIAHDLKYRDINKSLEYGEAALKIARNIGDQHLIAKCLCSVAESHIYSQNLSRADLYLEAAAELCQTARSGAADMRELGRILKNWGLVSLLQGRPEAAAQKLLRAQEISNSMGDRRRTATAYLYTAVLKYRLGLWEEADAYLESAIRASYSLGDGRYLVPEVLTYARWHNPDFNGQLSDLARCGDCERLGSIIAEVGDTARYETYAAFWREFFWPTLFGPINASLMPAAGELK